MIVISGVPRSGTSLMTNILLKILGEDRLIGSKFMGRDIEKKRPDPAKRKKRELSPIRQYEKDKLEERMKIQKPEREKQEGKKRDFDKMKDMNPNGFYECPFTVQGLFWRPKVHELMKQVDALENEAFCKIVSNGLIKSDPTKISKIIYMLRDPHEVAKSQEKLSRPQVPGGKDLKIHSPDFFISATVQFCRWITKYASEVEVLIVSHNELLKDPAPVVERVAAFIGEEPGEASKIVDPTLYRSNVDHLPHPQFKDAEAIEKLMEKYDFQGVLDYMKNPELETHKERAQFHCHRLGMTVKAAQCKACKMKPDVVANFIKTADKKGIDWKAEPCAYDCGALPGGESISINESIEKSHWL